MNEIEQLKLRITYLETLIQKLVKSDRYVFEKDIEMADGRNMQLNTGTGTKIGTATTQKLGFFNKTPVVQQGAITTPSGGATIDAEARTAIGQLKTALFNLGLTA